MIIPTKDMSFNTLIGSMVVDFPEDNIPLSADEDNWRLWAGSLLQEDSFSRNGAPNPNAFEDRTQWLQALYYSVASIS